MSEPTLFNYIGDISHDKKYLYDELTDKNYSSFMVNRGLGQHIDTILLANEMNKRPDISKLMHHDFLFHSVERKKRYGKWAKADITDSDVIEFIRNKYDVNQAVALYYISMMDKDELESYMKQTRFKGGQK